MEYSSTRLYEWLKLELKLEVARDIISLVLSCVWPISPFSDDLFTCLVFSFWSCHWLSYRTPIWIIHLGVIYLSQLHAAPLKVHQIPLQNQCAPCSLPSMCWIMEVDLNGKQVDRHSSRCCLKRARKGSTSKLYFPVRVICTWLDTAFYCTVIRKHSAYHTKRPVWLVTTHR